MAKRTFLDITSDIAEVKADFWLSEKEIDQKLGELYWEIAKKENGVYWYYKNLDKTIEMAEDYKKKMDNNIKKLKYTQKKLKELVINAYESTDNLPAFSDFNPVKIMNSSSVEIIEESKIPLKYWVKVETTKLDKKLMLKDLRDGIKIPGCDLKKKPYVKGLK